jgi:hypothetical protein
MEEVITSCWLVPFCEKLQMLDVYNRTSLHVKFRRLKFLDFEICNVSKLLEEI